MKAAIKVGGKSQGIRYAKISLETDIKKCQDMKVGTRRDEIVHRPDKAYQQQNKSLRCQYSWHGQNWRNSKERHKDEKKKGWTLVDIRVWSVICK